MIPAQPLADAVELCYDRSIELPYWLIAMRFNCPTCSQLMECNDGMAGMKAICPKCAQKVLIPTPAPIPTPTPKTTLGKIETNAPIDMSVGSDDKKTKCICPHCSTPISVSVKQAGQTLTCVSCNGLFRAPGPPSQAVPIPPASIQAYAPPLTKAVPPAASFPPPVPTEAADDEEIAPRKPHYISCPFCKGDVPHGAMKCKHCGETLDAGARAGE
jgi:hypothetical protein